MEIDTRRHTHTHTHTHTYTHIHTHTHTNYTLIMRENKKKEFISKYVSSYNS